MTFGVQIYAADGTTLVFDSLTATGGITADVQTVAASTPQYSINYPQWAGYAAFVLDHGGSAGNVAVVTTSGYPVVTVYPSPTEMTWSLVVF